MARVKSTFFVCYDASITSQKLKFNSDYALSGVMHRSFYAGYYASQQIINSSARAANCAILLSKLRHIDFFTKGHKKGRSTEQPFQFIPHLG
jgi:hypothetical protein